MTWKSEIRGMDSGRRVTATTPAAGMKGEGTMGEEGNREYAEKRLTLDEAASEVVQNAASGMKMLRVDNVKGTVVYVDKREPEMIDLDEAKRRLVALGYPEN
jgi:hypothetical protein